MTIGAALRLTPIQQRESFLNSKFDIRSAQFAGWRKQIIITTSLPAVDFA